NSSNKYIQLCAENQPPERIKYLTRGTTVNLCILDRIGLAIARRLAQDGAHVVVSSRKQANVDRAVAELQTENLSVSGLVCHVGKAEDRQRLINAVRAKAVLRGGIPRKGVPLVWLALIKDSLVSESGRGGCAL
uniref:Dehydrogenase/reductase 2 n=1 Tax=Podarcis muralis TaxID=64176 RepID=A0A670K527_PODMU